MKTLTTITPSLLPGRMNSEINSLWNQVSISPEKMEISDLVSGMDIISLAKPYMSLGTDHIDVYLESLVSCPGYF